MSFLETPALFRSASAHPEVEYRQAREAGSIATDLDIARAWAGIKRRGGLPVELIWVEAVVSRWPVSDQDANRIRTAEVEFLTRRSEGLRRPTSFTFLGFDVSPPVPSYHSAIFQPGPGRRDGLPEKLNEFGLLDDLAAAEDLMDEANRDGYGISNFSVIRVLAENTQPDSH